MRPIAVALLAALAAGAATADVYRWTDDHGVVHYGDKPPKPDAKPVDLPPIQTYRPNEPVGVAPSTAEDVPATPAAAFAITSPRPEETIRDGEGRVTVAVNANLKPGEGLVYLLDGRPQNKVPTPSTALLIEGVERGEHQISATLVAEDGLELARAAPVTIYLMPPTVKGRAATR